MIHYSLQVHPAGYRSCKHCKGWGAEMEDPAEWAPPSPQRETVGKHVDWREHTPRCFNQSQTSRVYHQGVSVTRRSSGMSRRREGFRERAQKYRVYAHDTERGASGTQRILHGADPSLPCGGPCAPLNLRDWDNGRQPIKAEKRIGKAAQALVTTPHCPPGARP